MRGRGLPSGSASSAGATTPGDLYGEIKVVVPETLTDTERDLFEKLALESPFRARDTAR
jgi:DnaJ-class molecular chaperone